MFRKRRRQFSSVGGALDNVLSRLGLAERLAQMRALVLWDEVVGPQIAAATCPLSVRDGILFVATKSSVWSHELIFRKASILASLRKQAGATTLTDIRFVARGYREDRGTEEAPADPWPRPEEWQQVMLTPEDKHLMEHILEPIGDPDLRARVARVVAHDLRSRRWKEQHGWRQCPQCGLPYPGKAPLCELCRSRGGK